MDMWSLYTVVFLSVLLPATRAIEPTTPNVTRTEYSPALTGQVAVGFNKTTSIWCSASATVMFRGRKTLRDLFWQYSNGTRVPVVERGEPSDLDVYAERHSGSVRVGTRTWRRLLHFKRAQPSSAGNYTCVANYNQNFPRSVEIRVTDIDCGFPDTPKNGQLRGHINTLYTSKATYLCRTGYTLQGSNTRTCQSNGQWSGSVPQCIANSAVDCGDPGTPTNGQQTLSSTTYNSVVTYTCDAGYTLQGSNSRTCQSNGQWSGSVPQCRAVDCGDPGTPTNGERSLSRTVFSYVVTYTCDLGYTLQGSTTRTCQSNGQWSGSVPQCNAVDCGDPGTLTNGQRSLSSTTYNSVVTYTCDLGYTLQGSTTRTCQSNGQWSGSAPQCNAVDCGDPGTPTNGECSLSSTTYNSVVTYTCDVGYTLQGSNSRTCQSNGQWSGSVPQCSFVTSLNASSPLPTLSLTLSWDTKARSGTFFTVWYSTDGHESDPTSPPQGALMVSVLNSTSTTITLPDSDDSCKPYYVWIAGITPNGQQTPYSKRWRVEVCKASGGESPTAAESAGATVAGTFLGGVVAGGAAALLVVGILCGSWKLKHSSRKSCKMNSEEETENTYDTVGPKESTAMSAHVAMETNPAYGVCSSKQ